MPRMDNGPKMVSQALQRFKTRATTWKWPGPSKTSSSTRS